VIFTQTETVNMVFFSRNRADVSVSTHRLTLLTIYYDFPQRINDAYRDISRQLIKNISFFCAWRN